MGSFNLNSIINFVQNANKYSDFSKNDKEITGYFKAFLGQNECLLEFLICKAILFKLNSESKFRIELRFLALLFLQK